MPVPSALNKNQWQKIVLRVNSGLLEELDRELGDGRSARDQLLIAGIANSERSLINVFGKGGKITPTTTRYFYFVITVIDIVLEVRGPWNGVKPLEHFHSVQRSYQRLKRSYGAKGGKLSLADAGMARAVVISELLNLRSRPEELEYFARNYDSLKNYLPIIVQRKEICSNHLAALLDTKPQLALSEGAL